MGSEKKNSVLLVDDENTNLEILVQILRNDYIIYTATNGRNAIEIAIEFKPDLILLDIIMPDMDGYEALCEMKNYEETKNIPVIFVTSLTTQRDEEKGLALGAVDYITKPFSNMIVKLRVKNQFQILNQFHTIQNLSMIDHVTNIPNRRSLDERLNIEWKQSTRENLQISILIIDIDKFKVINDTYGHQQGDIVLQMIANILLHALNRPIDFAARWGGDEFVVLLPNTTLDGAMHIGEKIRADVENTDFFLKDGSKIKITISVGVNSCLPERDSSINEFIAIADKALYLAKNAERNKVMHN